MKKLMNVSGNIVEFKSKNGLILHGLLFREKNAQTTIIHVHGSCGNFLSFRPVLLLGGLLPRHGINFFSINTVGYSFISEALHSDEYEYIGGSIMPFDLCVHDIKSAIDFCKTFTDDIILHGHSMGCDRVMFYQIKTKDFYDTVLVSPCDSYQLQTNFNKKETVEQQISRLEKVEQRDELEMLPLDEYGVVNGEYKYNIPISKKSLLSIMKGAPYKLFRPSYPDDFHIASSSLTFIGEKDKLQTHPHEKTFEHIGRKFDRHESHLIADSDHEMFPSVDIYVEHLLKWLSYRKTN